MTELSYNHTLTQWIYEMIKRKPSITIKEMINLANDFRILKNENDIFYVVQDLVMLKAIKVKGKGWQALPYEDKLTV